MLTPFLLDPSAFWQSMPSGLHASESRYKDNSTKQQTCTTFNNLVNQPSTPAALKSQLRQKKNNDDMNCEQMCDNDSSDSDDPEITVPVDVFITPQVFRRTKVSSLFTNLSLLFAQLRIELSNKHYELKDILMEILSNMKATNEKVEGHGEWMTQLSNKIHDIGYGTSNFTTQDYRILSEIYESTEACKRQLDNDEHDSIAKRVRGPTGRPSPSVFVNPDPYVYYDHMKGMPLEHQKAEYILRDFICNEEENQIIAYINSCPRSKVLASIDGFATTKKTFEILTKQFVYDSMEKCLVDTIVDARINVLRFELPGDTRNNRKVYLENTRMFQLLERDGVYDIPKGAVEEKENREIALNYLKHDMIFLPIQKNFHWYVVVVNPTRQEIQVLDSMVSTKEGYAKWKNELIKDLKHVLKGMETYLKLVEQDHMDDTRNWPNLQVSHWRLRMPSGLPQQIDRTSCGLFMLKYMEYWNGDFLPVMFNQFDIDQFRRKLAALLVKSPLNSITLERSKH